MSIAVSNLGVQTSLLFVQPEASVDSSYYCDVVRSESWFRLLPNIQKLWRVSSDSVL